MSYKVIVNGIDVLKDIEYKENLIKDLKDVISKQNKLLGLYRQLVKDLGLIIEYDMTDTWSGLENYEYLEINSDSIKSLNTYKQIKELENEL